MPYVSTTGGLNFQYPTDGTTNFGSTMVATWTKLSAHNHEGSGNGVQLGTAAFQANAVDGSKLRLANAQWLRARNAAGSADINAFRVNGSDRLEIDSTIIDPVTWTPSVTPSGSLTGTPTVNFAKYTQLGKFADVFLDFTVTLGGSGNVIAYTQPVAGRTGCLQSIHGSVLRSGSYYYALQGIISGGGTGGTITLYNYANIDTGVSLRFFLTGRYLTD